MTKTYAQLTREIQALQAHADKLRHSEKQDVIAKLNASIAAYDLRPEDLRFAESATASPKSSRRTASAGNAKYSDGQGNVWGGRGLRPAWLREAVTQGRSLESFAATGKARGATGASTPAKVSLPPLYSHPKTGQTWSGRGPKPAWLKQGLKKRGASIDDFLISAREPAPSSTIASDAAQTFALQKGSSTGRTDTTTRADVAPAQAVVKAAPKSLAQKVGKRTQGSVTKKAVTSTSPTAASGKKAAAGKSTGTAVATSSSSQSPRTGRKATGGGAPDAAGARAASSAAAKTSAPAKKAAAPASIQGDSGRKPAKPSAKKTAPARKNPPTSMAPPSVTPMPTTAPSTEPVTPPAPSTGPETTSAPEVNPAP